MAVFGAFRYALLQGSRDRGFRRGFGAYYAYCDYDYGYYGYRKCFLY
jgi:hypothetical protein